MCCLAACRHSIGVRDSGSGSVSAAHAGLTALGIAHHAACAAWSLRAVQVHARNKSVDLNINWQEVARAMSGFTGGAWG
jgi:hypothetical protein